MDADKVIKKLDEIRRKADSDPEAAHALRDNLYLEVLKSIACGSHRPLSSSNLAAMAIKAQKIKLKWEACA